MKAKLVNGVLEYAPTIAKVGRTDHIPPTDEWLRQNGYKDVVFTDPPVGEDEYEPSWEEHENEIVRVWTISHVITNIEKRQQAYETRPCVRYETAENGTPSNEIKMLTVDEANKRVQQYEAEGIDMSDLKLRIHLAKERIREEFPES